MAPAGVEPALPKKTDFKTSQTDHDATPIKANQIVIGSGEGTMVHERGTVVHALVQNGPREAMARALELAAGAGEWETVRALAEALRTYGQS